MQLKNYISLVSTNHDDILCIVIMSYVPLLISDAPTATSVSRVEERMTSVTLCGILNCLTDFDLFCDLVSYNISFLIYN